MLKLAKPNWNLSESVQLCSLKLEHNRLGKISANVRKVEGKDLRFKSEIFNSTNELIGCDEFSMVDSFKKAMTDLKIKSDEKYRDFGICKLLRLVSIMEMLKNQIKTMDLYSLRTAIYFHSKFGFEPKISNALERDATLISIAANSKNIFNDFYDNAKRYSYNISAENCDLAEMREKVNKLTSDFIHKVLAQGKDEYKNYPFEWGIDMQLTDKKIGEMRDFYNQSYRDSGIDYKV